MIFAELFLVFLKIGAFTFGGGYAMLPLVMQEVEAHAWMTDAELIDFVAVSESTPGPFAVNMATFVGTKTAGFAGALCATLGVVLPSFVIILLVAGIYDRFQKSFLVKSAMSGLRPAVVGLIACAVVTTGRTVFMPDGFSTSIFRTQEFWVSLGIFVTMFILALKKVHPIIIILASAAIGIMA